MQPINTPYTPPWAPPCFAFGHLQKIFFPVFQTLLTIRLSLVFAYSFAQIYKIVLNYRYLCVFIVYICRTLLIFAPD